MKTIDGTLPDGIEEVGEEGVDLIVSFVSVVLKPSY